MNRRIDPRGLPPQRIQLRACQTLAVHLQRAAGEAVPSQHQAEQRGFARTRFADDGDVFAGRDGKINVAQNGVARRQHVALRNGDTCAAAG